MFLLQSCEDEDYTHLNLVRYYVLYTRLVFLLTGLSSMSAYNQPLYFSFMKPAYMEHDLCKCQSVLYSYVCRCLNRRVGLNCGCMQIIDLRASKKFSHHPNRFRRNFVYIFLCAVTLVQKSIIVRCGLV